jgi:hypothetical protein
LFVPVVFVVIYGFVLVVMFECYCCFFFIPGLVKELDTHKTDHANKHLTSHATYVLVRKEIMREDTLLDPNSTPLPPQYTYIPLLEKYDDHYPNFNIRSAEIQKPLKTKSRTGKSPSPAGRYSTKQGAKKLPSGKVTTKRK